MEQHWITKTEKLQNGLTLVSCPMPWAQTVAAHLWIRAGSRSETPETWGVAHFLEHAVFDGTEQYPTNKVLTEALNMAGGELDAYTDKEAVVFKSKFPKEQGLAASDFLLDLMTHPGLRKEDIEKEKEIISQEMAERRNDPTTYRWDFALRSLWPQGHPLGRDSIGEEKSIRSFSASLLRNYIDATYVPGNMVLTVAGALSDEIIAHIRKTWGELKGSVQSVSVVGFEASKAHVDTIQTEIRAGLDQAYLTLAIPIPLDKREGDSWWDISVFDEMLRQRIFNALVYEAGLAYSATSYAWRFSDHVVLVVSFAVASGSAERAMQEVVRLFANPADSHDLDQAKASLKKSLFLNFADSNDIAGFIAEQQFFTDKAMSPDEVKKIIDSVELAKIQDFWKYIRISNAAISAIAPSDIKNILRDLQK